jgi:hypothetical protein
MPTATGAETIAERLLRKRTELAAVRTALARSTVNGESFNLTGAAVTQVAFEKLEAREVRLAAEVRRLEARAAGAGFPTALAHTQTRVA